MATLSPTGRIDFARAETEVSPHEAALVERIRKAGGRQSGKPDGYAGTRDIDPFDRVQLFEASRVCRASRSLPEAGRILFAASRTRRRYESDADRLRKYLARFNLS